MTMEDTRKEEVRDEELPLETEAEASAESPAVTDADLAAQRDEYLALWKRAQADYKNLRRRALADLEAGVRRSMLPLLESLLLVLDHLDMALASPTESQDAKNFAVGVQMTRDQMLAALEREEVREIPTDGAFDPELHQAVGTATDTDAEPGTIAETVRKGFTWRETVLRHAQVRVAGAADDEQQAEG